jgi:hypothetical protein
LCVHASWWMGATSLVTWKTPFGHYFLQNSWWVVGNMEAKLYYT